MARAGRSRTELAFGTVLLADGSQVFFADVAQLVEHSLGKGEVTSSILVIGSTDYHDSSRRAGGVAQW
jgi:hypothetical protein